MLGTVAELVEYLEPESDEIAVLSAVLHASAAGERLCRASLLIAPRLAGEGSWRLWQEAHMVAGTGASEPNAPTYLAGSGDLLAGRAVLSVDEACSWLDELTRAREAWPIGPIPRFTSELGPAVAPVRASAHLDTAASSFITQAVRPAIGFHFPGLAPDVEEVPLHWDAEGERLVNAPLALGLSLGTDTVGGLFLGRLERRAWMSRLRGGERLETFDVSIGFDPARVALDDLTVVLEEWVDEELVHAQQLHLERLDIEHVRGATAVTVSFPTLGTRIKRSVRLYDRSGTLLDASSPSYLLEQISLSVRVMGSDERTVTTIGDQPVAPTLVDRAASVQKVTGQYQELYAAGAETTLVPAGNARALLANRLLGAPGGLVRIVDRYFGQDLEDWTMLASLSPQFEVITSSGTPPDTTPANVTIR